MSKLLTYEGQTITTIGNSALVKSVITCQAVYFIMSLVISPSTLNNVDKLERDFLWSGSDRTTIAKCKVNREVVCRPHGYGGLGVLNPDKFVHA